MNPEKRDDGFYYHDGKKIAGRHITDGQGRTKWLYRLDHASGELAMVAHFDYADEFDRWFDTGEHIDGQLSDAWIYEDDNPNPLTDHETRISAFRAKAQES